MVGKDELDSEVEQADVIKEKIGVCIMDIEQAFQRSSISRTTPVDGSVSRRASLTEGAASSHPHSDKPPTSPSTDTPSSPTPPDDLTDPVLIPPPVSDEATPPSSAPHIKLPKISIKKFGGELTKWVTFWDSFDSSIHTNPNLSDVDKFTTCTLTWSPQQPSLLLDLP